MATEILDREKLINKIWDRMGKVSFVAQDFNVSSQTIYNYASKYATVQAALDGARAHFNTKLIDIAELRLHESVGDGERWAITHTLNNSPEAKRRGWGPKQEIDIPDGVKIQIEYVNDWRND